MAQTKLDIKRLIEVYHSTFPIRDLTGLHTVLCEVGVTVLPEAEGPGGVRHWIEQAQLKEPVFPLSYESFMTLIALFISVKRKLKATTTDAASFNMTFGDELAMSEVEDTCRMFQLTPDMEGVSATMTVKDFLSWASQEVTSWGNNKEQSTRARQRWATATLTVMNRVKSETRVKRLLKGGKEASKGGLEGRGGRQKIELHNAEELKVTKDCLLANHEERIKAGRAKCRHWNFRVPRSIKAVEELKPMKITSIQALMRMCVGINGDSVSCQLARKLRDMMHRTRACVLTQSKRRRKPRSSSHRKHSDDSDGSDTESNLHMSPSLLQSRTFSDSDSDSFVQSPKLKSHTLVFSPKKKEGAPSKVLSMDPCMGHWTQSGVNFLSKKWYEVTTHHGPLTHHLMSDLRSLKSTSEADRVLASARGKKTPPDLSRHLASLPVMSKRKFDLYEKASPKINRAGTWRRAATPNV